MEPGYELRLRSKWHNQRNRGRNQQQHSSLAGRNTDAAATKSDDFLHGIPLLFACGLPAVRAPSIAFRNEAVTKKR